MNLIRETGMENTRETVLSHKSIKGTIQTRKHEHLM